MDNGYCVSIIWVMLFFITGFLLVTLVVGCENWPNITFENHTQASFKVETRGVLLDFVEPSFNFSYAVDFSSIKAGKSMTFVTCVPNG
jgi:hypothetical protein